MMRLAEISDAHIREAAQTVLRQSPYAQWRRSAVTFDWLEWLRDWLDGLGTRLDALQMAAPLLYWLTVGGVLLAALLMFAHIVWSIRIALAKASPGALSPRAAGGPSLAAEADGLANQGRFLEAARRLQLAAIELLLRDRAITLSRSEPNRILRRRVQGAPLAEPERRDLLGLVDRLEIAWFRDRTEDAELYRAWQLLYRRLAARGGAA